MRGLWTQSDKVPEHVGILQMGLRITLLGVDETREQNGITNEEDGCVVANQIPNAIIGVELHGEAARIASSISRTALTADSRETNSHWRALLDLLKDLGGDVFGDVMSDFQITKSTDTLGVHNTFGNALTIEMRRPKS